VVGWNVHTSGSSGWEDHIGDLVQSLRLMRDGTMEGGKESEEDDLMNSILLSFFSLGVGVGV
jgi:hypothetical protein